MRRLIFTLFALLLAVAASGQVSLRYGSTIDAGYGSKGSIFTPYVTFPADFVKPYVGNQVTKVRIGMNGAAKNVTLYIKKNDHDSRPAYSQKVGTLERGWNEISLETPYAIADGEAIAIGYKATAVDGAAGGFCEEDFPDAAAVYFNTQSKWTSISGSFCIEAIVEGDQLPGNELMLGSIANQTAGFADTTACFKGVVRNVGCNAVTAYAVKVAMDGTELETVNVEKTLDVNESDTFQVVVLATETGTHQLTFTISQVNGGDDAYAANNTAKATLTVRDPRFQRRVLCEEFTGLWCGWCPRGLVGLELMKEAHPGLFIAVSIHGGDVLEVDTAATYNYKGVTDLFTGAPSCIVDRKSTGDPYYDINTLFQVETLTDAAASLNVTAHWNSDSTAITAEADYVAAADMAAADWNMAFVLTEDSVTGYAQSNYFAGGTSGEFYGWENKDGHTTDVVFNDLARGIFSNSSGDECHRGALVAGERQQHQYTFAIPATVANKKNVHVVAILLDSQTGFALNSAYTSVDAAETTAIENLTDGFAGVAGSRYELYDAAGKRVGGGIVTKAVNDIPTARHGLYFVKLHKGNQTKTIKIIR